MTSTKKLTIDKTLNAPLSAVWPLLADYGNIGAWNPNLKSSRLLEGPARGVGAKRQCDMSNGKDFVREVVTDWQEGRSMSIDIFEGTMPFESASATVTVAEASGRQTRVRFTMSYTPRAGLGGAFMGFMAKPMLKRAITQLLQGLESSAAGSAPAARSAAHMQATA